MKEYTVTITVKSDLYWEEIKDIIDDEVTEILESNNVEVEKTWVSER